MLRNRETYRVAQEGLRLADGLALHHQHGELSEGVGAFSFGLGKVRTGDALIVEGNAADWG